MGIALLPGDIVCVTYSMDLDPDGKNYLQAALTYGIRKTQCFNDVDGKAHFTHTFFITDVAGTTFEALWKYRKQNLYKAYAGQEVLIGRHHKMTRLAFYTAYSKLHSAYNGKNYPALKLPAFLFFPRLLKYIPGKPVCSELTGKLLYDTGCIDHWRGITPSYIADMIRRWKDFSTVYNGILPIKKEV